MRSDKFMRRTGVAAMIAAGLISAAGGGVSAASALHAATASAEAPGGARPNRWGYGWARAYDAEIAAPDVHRLRYEDDHIQFLEVSNPPGYHMRMHGHPYPSVFARMSGGNTAQGLSPNERFLDPGGTANGQNWRSAPAPAGTAFPTCTAADPQAPHLPVNASDAPLHFYRVEFKRVDQDAPGRLTRYRHLPARRTLYESDAVRLVEITVAPALRAAPRPGSDPAVLAFDTEAAFSAVDAAEPTGTRRSLPPAGMTMPRCMTTARGDAPVIANRGPAPLHYYRIEFKRIDGAALKDHWRSWYPEMTRMH